MRLFSYTIPLMLISSLVIFNGCDLISKSELKQVSDSELYDLYAEFVERYESDKGLQLFLYLSSQKQFQCSNYRLLIQQLDSESNDLLLTVEIKGAELSGNFCATAIGPAIAFIPFENRDAIKEVKLKNGHRSDLLTVTLTSEKASVDLKEGTFVQVNEPELYRTPKHSMYSMCLITDDTNKLCESWFELLESETYVERFEFPENARITYPENRTDYPFEYRYFIYGSEEYYENVEDLFTDFVIQHTATYADLNIGISNWKGETKFSSQILD